METNHETYTYTARNADDPSKVVTFTLYDHHMRVNLTGLLDQASTVAGADDKPEEIRQQISAQMKPTMTKIVENFTEPAHISDIDASLEDEHLKVLLWQRLGGLRLAPMQFNMGKIDNTEAAEAFVDELDQRKKTGSYAGRFSGPLDYWAGWLGLLLLVGILFRWSRRREES